MTSYLSYDIFEPSIFKPEPHNIVNNYKIIGDIYNSRETYVTTLTNSNFSLNMYQDSTTDRTLLKDFFIGKKGKLSPFWYVDPVPLGRSLGDSDTAEFKFSDTSLTFAISIESIFIYSPSDNYVGKVTSITKGETAEYGKYEELTCREVVPSTIANNTLFYRIYFVRFDQDTLTFNAESFNTSIAKVMLQELQEEIIKLAL